jgi:methionyl-tRNA formyltransferase
VTAVADGRAVIACGEGSLLLCRGQVEGRKALDAAQLVAGRTLGVGSRFG